MVDEEEEEEGRVSFVDVDDELKKRDGCRHQEKEKKEEEKDRKRYEDINAAPLTVRRVLPLPP